MEPSRLKAANKGLRTYKGRPCARHPESERYTATGQCRACTIERAAAHNRKNSEELRRLRAESMRA